VKKEDIHAAFQRHLEMGRMISILVGGAQ
jgi:hypothetical protein